MDVKKLVLLIGALLVAAVTAVMAKNMFSGASAPQAQAAPVVKAGPEVLVAAHTLPVGTIIDPEALRYQTWPEGTVQPSYFTKGEAGADPKTLVGTVVRNEITAGQPITQGALIKPGERGFLAAALGPGMRAITVPVSVTSGVAGFVFPGDRVDIMLTQNVSGGGDGPPLKVTETILRNVRILASDQRTTAINEDGKPEIRNAATVTLEVTPKIAEKIAVAQSLGPLSMVLRSIADNAQDFERAIATGDTKVPQSDDPKAEKQMLLQVAGKPVDTTPSFTVGGEVSRYQRSTVPGKPTDAAAASAQPVPGVRVARGNTIIFVPLGAN